MYQNILENSGGKPNLSCPLSVRHRLYVYHVLKYFTTLIFHFNNKIFYIITLNLLIRLCGNNHE